MQHYLRTDPIVAVSTGTQTKSAIGIIRITGLSDLSSILKLTGLKSVKPRYAHFVILKHNDEIYDEGLLLFFPGPNSFTGEDIIELQVHGNPFNLERIVRLLIDEYGLKKAHPGEFTYRALRNKKMNLTQVEGLDLLLNATSSFGLSSATKVLNNELYGEYTKLRDIYIALRSAIEISIDFSEDVGDEQVDSLLKGHTDDFDKLISALYRRTQGDLNNLLTPKIALFGKTNAGKSTLFNSLVGQDRAIVSDVHGTTRDFVSEYIYIDGQAYQLIDTAGLRLSNDAIENEGIKRGKELVHNSFIKVLVLDATLLNEEALKHDIEPDLIVLTHVDLLKCESRDEFLSLVKRFNSPVLISGPMGANSVVGPMGPAKNQESGPIEPENSKTGPMGADFNIGPIGPEVNYQFGPIGPVLFSNGPIGAEYISGPIGPEISLNSIISDRYSKMAAENPIPISRHREVIGDIYSKFADFKEILFNESDLGLISHEINMLSVLVDELIGVVNPDDVLDNIFSNFCIGK